MLRLALPQQPMSLRVINEITKTEVLLVTLVGVRDE
jgi:hypothetical protein